MKKIISLILTLLLMFSTVPAFAVSTADFEASAGESLGVTGTYIYTDWNGVAHEVDLITLEVPAGTEEVTLTFPEAVLAFNYGFNGEGDPSVTDDNYLASSYDDAMAGSETGTVQIDSDANGIADFIQVQTPYDENWNSEVLYAIGFSVIGGLAPVETGVPEISAVLSGEELQNAVKKTADYLMETVTDPVSGDVGGEWVVLGLARSGLDISEDYFNKYYNALCTEMDANGGNLSDRKYTEYSRVLLALEALGLRDNSGELLQAAEKLGDADAVCAQGLNGPVWALIALRNAEAAGYPLETVAQKVRPVYLQEILDAQNPDGGFALAGDTSDVDMTAMVLQALAGFCGEEAENAIEKALNYLAEVQNPDGGFTSFGTTGSESVSRVIIALCEQGIDLNDERFVKDGGTLLGNLMGFALDNGAFAHVKDGSANQISTEQAMMALVSALRSENAMPSLFDMSDAKAFVEVRETAPAEVIAPAPSAAAEDTGSDGTFRILMIICMAFAALLIFLASRLKKKATRIIIIVLAAFLFAASAITLFSDGKTGRGAGDGGSCTISIDCCTLLNNMDMLDEEKRQLVPEDGIILEETTVSFSAGETVADVLKRVCKDNKIHMEAEFTAVTNSTFVEGIGNIYELDAGALSGWKYSVNRVFPGFGCSNYTLSDGDEIVWAYTCDMGADIGAGSVEGNN